ncbi:Leucine-rich repeat receptor-like protein kinase PEPR2 [Camellia lanceoleosa]|uniref:Leucine-rich repeat receptor-like protein kinase PEPR2 n=1 Tax=Camellia lanceoleosa TaxID=1840588 RepID=A0ACC0IXH0_9ERIC|nr:Leucine-rich repeat receptor-like protein kinase PEPR2 [Camellia lanceoleosa]
MQSLSILNLAWNNLQGQISGCLCEINSFTDLHLSHNQLHGDIDACFSNMSSLEKLDISANSFNGTFPSLLFSNLTNIEFLFGNHNDFTGRISLSSFANLSKLSFLHLLYNDLEVETESLSWLPSFNLHGLYLGGCNLNSHVAIKSPALFQHNTFWSPCICPIIHLLGAFLLGCSIPPLDGMRRLSILDLSSSGLDGEVLIGVTGNVTSLQYMDLSLNKLHGGILPKNSSMPNLKSLNLHSNMLSKMNPDNLFECSSLRVLDVAKNDLSRELSTQRPHLPMLMVLILRQNYLQGKIPEHLCQSN